MLTEKVIVPIFLAIVAGLITAIMAIVKLVNDKEAKTTDYRQAWTQSVRASFAELISNVHLLANGMVKRLELQEDYELVLARTRPSEPATAATADGTFIGRVALAAGLGRRRTRGGDTKAKLDAGELSLKYATDRMAAEDAYIREQWRNLHRSHALTRLHFKQDDKDFGKLEKDFKAIRDGLDALEGMKGSGLAAARTQQRSDIQDNVEAMTESARKLLKQEWEQIKRGERMFEKTKRYAFLFTLAAAGVLAVLSVVIVVNAASAPDTPSLATMPASAATADPRGATPTLPIPPTPPVPPTRAAPDAGRVPAAR